MAHWLQRKTENYNKLSALTENLYANKSKYWKKKKIKTQQTLFPTK